MLHAWRIAEAFGNSKGVLLGVFGSKNKVAEAPGKVWESVERDFTNQTCSDTCPWVVFPFRWKPFSQFANRERGQQLSTSASCSKPFREASPINSSERWLQKHTIDLCLDNILCLCGVNVPYLRFKPAWKEQLDKRTAMLCRCCLASLQLVECFPAILSSVPGPVLDHAAFLVAMMGSLFWPAVCLCDWRPIWVKGGTCVWEVRVGRDSLSLSKRMTQDDSCLSLGLKASLGLCVDEREGKTIHDLGCF